MISKLDVSPQQLSSYLDYLTTHKATGTLHITAKTIASKNKTSYVFIWEKGQITFAGNEIPAIESFVKNIVRKFKPELVNVVLNFIKTRITDPYSVRQHLDILVNIKTITWEQIEELTKIQSFIILEEILTLQTDIIFTNKNDFDISYGNDFHGLIWSELKLRLSERQQQWQKLDRTIISAQAVPSIVKTAFDTITDNNVCKHLQEHIDGKSTIGEIAAKLDIDTLKIANIYSKWINAGWIVCKNDLQSNTSYNNSYLPPIDKKLPKILSIDDSPIIQTTIKRALADRYQTIFVNNGTKALEVLAEQKFDLILLDVTMPDIDGLELCQIIRNKSKELAEIPIIMLTARAKFSDKFKGYTAGTTDYLTKPFDAEDLNKIVEKYLNW